MKYFVIIIFAFSLLIFPGSKKSKIVVKKLMPETKKENQGEIPPGKREPFWDLLKGSDKKIETLEKLMIGELRLEGIVKMRSGKCMALFISPKNRPFFVSVSQKLYNGEVIKITLNDVTFKKFPAESLPPRK